MREIKFRAWDKEKQKIVTLESIGFIQRWGNDYAISCGWQDVGDYLIVDKNIELMQYTGLKDKNGKEIYEGDIVQYSPADACRRPAEVYWEGEGCQFRLATGGDRQFDKTRMIQFSKIGEVIGNIYENPPEKPQD